MTQKHLPEDTSRSEETTLAQRSGAGLPATRRALAKLEPGQLEHADKIIISGLEVFANHGVYPEETALGQKFIVSATLFASLRRAGETDDLGESIHYGEVCHEIDAYLRSHTFKLIEAAAEHLADELLHKYPELLAVTDGVMLDIKGWDLEEHLRVTGVSNEMVLKNAEYLAASVSKSSARAKRITACVPLALWRRCCPARAL